MKENPKISVIIPIYNQEKYLRYCLESVLLQNLQEIEVICVNAGSTDGSFEMLSEPAWTDERLRIVQQEHKGADEARYAGAKEAQGGQGSVRTAPATGHMDGKQSESRQGIRRRARADAQDHREEQPAPVYVPW